jgi:hypothetical protein
MGVAKTTSTSSIPKLPVRANVRVKFVLRLKHATEQAKTYSDIGAPIAAVASMRLAAPRYRKPNGIIVTEKENIRIDSVSVIESRIFDIFDLSANKISPYQFLLQNLPI